MTLYTLALESDQLGINVEPPIPDSSDPDEPITNIVLMEDDDGEDGPRLRSIYSDEDVIAALNDTLVFAHLEQGDTFTFNGLPFAVFDGLNINRV